MDFTAWLEYFRANHPLRHPLTSGEVSWSGPPRLTLAQRAALVHSFQRFELGESGEGDHLLSHARAQGDPVYAEALATSAPDPGPGLGPLTDSSTPTG